MIYLRGPQGQYIYERTSTAECHQLVPESTVISGHTRHLRLRPYKTSPSPAIQDISVSGHTRHLRLRLYKTSPSPAETCICNNIGGHAPPYSSSRLVCLAINPLPPGTLPGSFHPEPLDNPTAQHLLPSLAINARRPVRHG